ncbi:multiprotein-bridging factor 1 family protein [archaeon]|nr:multiprotein-bridging factor 1 family protein [archaeon]
MKCEICGDNTYKPQTISVEGSRMKVCDKCARYGTVVRSFAPKRYVRREEKRLDLVENYALLIHQNREKMGITQEELGKKINESESIIRRLETHKMHPSEALARKLERVLRLKLLVPAEESKISLNKSSKEEFTLGDMARIRKR